MDTTPVSVSLQVRLPDNRLVVLELDKTSKSDNTAEWKLHFELQEQNSSGVMVSVATLTVTIDKTDHAAAAATASQGLDPNQRAQAAVAADTAKAVTTGDATKSDLKQDAKAIISARASNS